MISEPTVRSAIVATIVAADASAKVHRRFRYPAQDRLAEFSKLFRDDTGKVNGYMIRRVRRVPEMKGIPGRLVKLTHFYVIRFYCHLIDSEDDAIASEEIAQARIETLAARFESDVTIGLGPSVYHDGLVMALDFTDVYLGDAATHRADLQLQVTAANVSC